MHRLVSLFARAFTIGSALVGLGAAAGAAHAQATSPPRLATITVGGLAAGLEMRLGARVPNCDGRPHQGAIGFTVPMSADTELVFVPAELNGHSISIARRVPVYRAPPVTVPVNRLCPTERTEFVALVSGTSAGLTAQRTLHLVDLLPMGDDLVVSVQPRASTLLIRNGDNEGLSTLTRNVDQQVIATLDTDGTVPGIVNQPSLALQFPAQPKRGFPLPDVVVRFFAVPFGNGSRACIEKDGRVACEQFLANGLVRPAQLDGFECSVASVRGGRVDVDGRILAFFQFKLPLSLPVGQMELSVSANDGDLSTYNVNGTQQALDLLPWRPLNMPIFIQ